MTTPAEGELDLADIEVSAPPQGWAPETVEATPDPVDAVDADQEPDA